MDIGMLVGNIMEKGEVDAVASAIIRIMQAPGEQKTIRKALAVFHKMAEVKNVSISNCQITGDRAERHHHEIEEIDDGDADDEKYSPWISVENAQDAEVEPTQKETQL